MPRSISAFMRPGLLQGAIQVYLMATRRDTETVATERLRTYIRRQLPDAPAWVISRVASDAKDAIRAAELAMSGTASDAEIEAMIPNNPTPTRGAVPPE